MKKPVTLPEGTRKGSLLLLRPIGKKKGFRTLWLCICDCGKEHRTLQKNFSKKVKPPRRCNSCKHKKYGSFSAANGVPSPEYHAYVEARKRCNDPRHTSFKIYGGRGIKFRFDSFDEFIAEVGPRPTGAKRTISIDRINNEGNYEPGNVRWATATQQCHRRRGWSKNTEYRGLNPSGSRWNAVIRKDRQIYKLGIFDSEIEAAQAYDAKAVELYGADAMLNFPR